jgi:2Fe-2S ferredoxin
MGLIYATDRHGAEHQIKGRENASFMEMLKQAGLDIAALCSGSCKCSTCHIYVDGEWFDKLNPPSDMELITLEEAEDKVRDNSRLGCQIKWDEKFDGIRVTVAPEN